MEEKVTLQVGNHEMTFTKKELETILESYFNNTWTSRRDAEIRKTVQRPEEGQWFQVNPTKIDRRLFVEEREDQKQECTRQLILEAFQLLDEKPEIYAGPFETMFPKKTWKNRMLIKRIRRLADVYGDKMMDWVEQALEWAQRIANGEAWEAVCNEPDTAECYKMIVWSKDQTKLVGSCCSKGDGSPASAIHNYKLLDDRKTDAVVPGVVRRRWA